MHKPLICLSTIISKFLASDYFTRGKPLISIHDKTRMLEGEKNNVYPLFRDEASIEQIYAMSSSITTVVSKPLVNSNPIEPNVYFIRLRPKEGSCMTPLFYYHTYNFWLELYK